MRPSCARFLVAAAFALVPAVSDVARAQVPPGPDVDRSVMPEQMVEEALEKIKTGDYRGAQDLVRRAKILKPTLDKLLLAEGLLAVDGKRPLEAIVKLEGYNKTDEGRNDYRGHAAVGTIYRDSRMYKQAIPSLERAKAMAPLEKDGKPLRATIAMDLASAYFRLDRKAKAMEAAKEAEQWAPDDPSVQLRFARVAYDTEDYKTAKDAVYETVRLLRTALRTDPLNRGDYSRLQSCYQLIGRLHNRETAAHPDDGSAYFRFARSMREYVEVNRRIGLLDVHDIILQALAKEPNNVEWLIYAARVQAELGALDDAKENLDKALRDDPENREAAEFRQSIQAGSR